jgi:hypothetical protein
MAMLAPAKLSIATPPAKTGSRTVQSTASCPFVRHQRIASNLCYVLTNRFRAHRLPLLPIFRIGLIVPGAELFRPFGDVVVVDDTAGEEDTAFVERFYLVAEVLSDGDLGTDIPAKRRHYVRHPQNLYFVGSSEAQTQHSCARSRVGSAASP